MTAHPAGDTSPRNTTAECLNCKRPVRRCAVPRPCSGQCSSGWGWIHVQGKHACDQPLRGWRSLSTPYARPVVPLLTTTVGASSATSNATPPNVGSPADIAGRDADGGVK